jgi:hypothetical protein
VRSHIYRDGTSHSYVFQFVLLVICCGKKCQQILKLHLGSSHHTHTHIVICCNALYWVIMICMGTRQIIYSMSDTLRNKNEIKARRKSPTLFVLNQVMYTLSTVTMDSIVTGLLRTSLSSSKGSVSVLTRESNENNATVSPCKSDSSSEITKSSSLRWSFFCVPPSMTAADISCPLLLLSSLSPPLSPSSVSLSLSQDYSSSSYWGKASISVSNTASIAIFCPHQLSSHTSWKQQSRRSTKHCTNTVTSHHHNWQSVPRCWASRAIIVLEIIPYKWEHIFLGISGWKRIKSWFQNGITHFLLSTYFFKVESRKNILPSKFNLLWPSKKQIK